MKTATNSRVRLGPFCLVRPIAAGGMGLVLKAVHEGHDHPVAVKIMTGKKAQEKRFARAFREEVRAVARLDHPNVVRIFDSGEISAQTEAASEGKLTAGRPYLVMELANSTLLDLDRQSLTWPDLQTILIHILDGLAHSHARGLIHRDLKPANILFADHDGHSRLILSDFGIAHAIDRTAADHKEQDRITGTPRYMAPEQITGDARDQGPWTDLYALGCLTYWLAGQGPPFDGKDVQKVFKDHIFAERPPLQARMEVPPGFEDWAKTLLARRPRDRFRRAADAALALAELDERRATNSLSLVMSDNESCLDMTLFDGGETTRVLYQPDLTNSEPSPPPTSASKRVPKIRSSWRYQHSYREPLELTGVGLGVYGLRHIPLVGRASERDRLWQILLDACHSGRPHGAILSGPAGIGKTRLATWLSERGHEVGAVDVLRATHSPISGPADGLGPMFAAFLGCNGLPHHKITERVRAFFGQYGEVDSDTLHQCMVLSSLLARSADPNFDDQTKTFRFQSREDRFVLWWQLIEVLAEQRPVVLQFDDVHWGSDTLQFVKYLFNRLDDTWLPVTVLMTVRDELLDEAPLAAELLEELSAAPLIDEINVTPLKDDEHRRLIHHLLGLESDVAEQVATRTAGNPLFAIQLVGDWVQRGVLEISAGGFRLASGERAPLPEDIHHLLVQRLTPLLGGDLDAPAAGADEHLISLELAATLGHEVDFREWRQARLEAGLDEFPAELLETLASQSLATLGDRSWRFAHGALRETLTRLAAEGGRLADHHRCCARALKAVYDTSQDRFAPRLARHFLAAGDDVQALEPLIAAIRHYHLTCQLEAGQKMAEYFEQTRRRLGLGDDDRRTIRGWIEEVILLIRSYRFDDAMVIAQRSQEICENHNWRDLLAKVLEHRLRIDRLRGHLDEAFAHGEQALKLHEEIDQPLSAAWTIYQFAWLYRWRGELQEARQAVTEAVERFETLDDDHGYGSALVLSGVIHHGLEDFEKADDFNRRALAIMERIGDRAAVLDCLNNLGENARSQGRLDEAKDFYQRVLKRAAKSGIQKQFLAHTNLAWTLMAQRNFGEARHQLLRAQQALGASPRPGLNIVVHIGLIACSAAAEDWSEFDKMLAIIRRDYERDRLVDPDLALALEWTCDLCLASGQPGRAREAAQMAISQWQTLGRTPRAHALQRRLPDAD